MAKLKLFVHVTDVDEHGNIRGATFGPDDDLPDWAVRAITNPDVWDGEPPQVDEAPASTELAEPPRHGKGSSTEAWRAFALSTGWFDAIADDTPCKEIIAAVDAQRAARAKE